MFTIFSFAAINYGLFKIDSSFFTYQNSSFFSFFYYSFNGLIPGSGSNIVARLPISQAVSMLESLLAFVLVAIFISQLILIKNQRYIEELNKLIKTVESDGLAMEVFIKKEFNLDDIKSAINELENLKASFFKMIYSLTKSIDTD